MIKNVIFLLFALLFSACASTKRVVDVSMSKVDSASIATTTAVQVEHLIDTTTTEKGRVVVTEIEFSQSDTSSAIASLSMMDGALSIGAIQGKLIKSIKQTAIERESERKGESKEKNDSKHQEQAASLQKENIKQTKQVAPATDPYKWRYVFYLSIVALAGYLVLKANADCQLDKKDASRIDQAVLTSTKEKHPETTRFGVFLCS